MLKYAGTGKVFNLGGELCHDEFYTIAATASHVTELGIFISEFKTLKDLQSIESKFQIDQNLQIVNIDGVPSSQWCEFSLAKIRKVVTSPIRILVESLLPECDPMTDLTEDERKVLSFVNETARRWLDILGLILIGSRAERTHNHTSDFDIVIEARGGPLAWSQVRDCVRNEAPTLLNIDVIDASTIVNKDFLKSVYLQGRFFSGKS